MSSRVTRSSARPPAGSSNENPPNPPAPPPPPHSAPATSRKRKKSAVGANPEQSNETPDTPSTRSGRAKRAKVEPDSSSATAPTRSRKAKGKAAMSSSGYVRAGREAMHTLTSPSPSRDPVAEKSARRGKGSRKSSSQGDKSRRDQPSSPHPDRATATPSTSRRNSRKSVKTDEDADMDDAPESKSEDDPQTPGDEHTSDDGNDAGAGTRYDEDDDDEDDDDDPFTSGFLGRNPHHGLSALRQLTGLMSGTAQRLRGILEQLKSPDVSMQLIALQDLSEVLLMASEDMLAGHFSPDAYVKELVKLMQPNDFTGEENPEVMLLACRCLANLMEALPAATANVVYGGAVPVLCSKLLEIDFIDLAEQCLSTLEKISVEFPTQIVREGGLTACLTFLDFFATSTQRTAVTTAANCCRNIPDDSFATVRDVMPILENILNNSDQKVVEQGCICVSRIVQSFRHQEDKLEQLVSPGLLKAILALLLPGTTNLIGPHIHTMFLQVIAYTAKASPRLSAELLKMNVVDTLYQILTGVSPPSGTEDVAAKIDSVVIMQALIHRPKDQVFETLNVICELLPDVTDDGLSYLDDLFDAGYPGRDRLPLSSETKQTSNEKRVALFEGCKTEVKRFAVILLPTLTDAYSSTVNLNVRQKVLTAHLKMLSNLDTDILEEALRAVPYASFLASIFSQQDHPTLVTYALQAAELLLKRLESIYRYQFYREGVIAEISVLASRPTKTLEVRTKEAKPAGVVEALPEPSVSNSNQDAEVEGIDLMDVEVRSEENDDDDDDDEDDGDEEHDGNGEDQDDDDDDDDSSSSSDQNPPPLPNVDDIITLRAKKFIEVHEKDSDRPVRDKAAAVLDDLKTLVRDLREYELQDNSDRYSELFTRLAKYFQGDALESITSYELKSSKVVDVLLDVFSTETPVNGIDPRSLFLEAFMGVSNKNKVKTASSASPATPFSVLVSKLQDLLSRSEHFEVITVHQNSYDGRGSAANMLAKQLRLKLVAEDDSGIPKSYRNIMVSIHAIATFKALDDYLRPRMHVAADRPRGSRTRDQFAAYAQALAEGRAPPPPETPNESTSRPSKKSSSSKSKLNEDSEAGPSSASREKTRRSSRRQQTQPPPPPPPPPAPKAHSSSSQDPLECADEERLSDQESLGDNAALNAIVDELEEELENELEDALDNDEPDPSAVSVEVASTGKATARKEDGTRIATPTPGTPSAKPSDRLSTPASRLTALLQDKALQRSLSYAAAIQSTPQDWHIEFSVNDQPISSDTTIYRVVHFNQAQATDVSQRTVWNAIHTIKFKRVAGPPPSEASAQTPPPEYKVEVQAMPASLDNHPITSGILRLLNLLHSLNSHLDDVLSDNKDQIKLNAEPLSQFVNTKLTAKLNRQLEEPLIVASNCLPSWSEDLARFYPFLFPFESRHLFVQSTSFGYSRCMTRWQNTQNANDTRNDRHRDERPFLGRLQRQKVRISRSRILESAMKVMQLYGHSPSVLEVEYFEEVGTGLGPTLEFYSTVSREFSKKKLKIWRENDSSGTDEYAFGKRGLFPAPMSAQQAASEDGEKKLEMFKVLGKFVARSMLDSRIIDVSFSPTLFRLSDSSSTAITPSLATIRTVDEDLAKSLRLLKRFADAKRQIDLDQDKTEAQRREAAQSIRFQDCTVEDLALDFTLPGYPSIELIENGAHTAVTIDNVGLYVDTVVDLTLGSGVKRQIDAFGAGFSEVFPYSALRAFTPDELVMLFGRNDEDWSLETLMDSIKADHGYNLDSKSVRNLLTTMSQYTPEERRDFLQFITGSPKLPIGGFKSLTPMFTVVCKPAEPPYTSDDYLPSVMTCVNYLKMPDYSTLDVLREKLSVAVKEGQGAFHLS
ncbi:ubiquitin-protein ligase [Stagonosporopsis vannaccii]|nr:ubiquitin-protein ligase [Stagonosporopsis vannaccii]